MLFLGEGNYAEFETVKENKSGQRQDDKHDNFIKSMRNIPKTEFALATNISGYDVIVAHDIVVTESALNELNQWLVLRIMAWKKILIKLLSISM